MSDGNALSRDTAIAATSRLVDGIGLTAGGYTGHSYRKGGLSYSLRLAHHYMYSRQWDDGRATATASILLCPPYIVDAARVM